MPGLLKAQLVTGGWLEVMFVEWIKDATIFHVM